MNCRQGKPPAVPAQPSYPAVFNWPRRGLQNREAGATAPNQRWQGCDWGVEKDATWDSGSSSLPIDSQRTQPLSFQETLRSAARRIQNTRFSRISSTLTKQLLHNGTPKQTELFHELFHTSQQSLVSPRSEAFSGEDRGWAPFQRAAVLLTGSLKKQALAKTCLASCG